MGAGVGREVCHVAAEHERLARNDRTSLIRPSACRIGYMARRETRNKNPALTLFLKLLRELYPDINIKILYERDYRNLIWKYGLNGPDEEENGGRKAG